MATTTALVAGQLLYRIDRRHAYLFGGARLQGLHCLEHVTTEEFDAAVIRLRAGERLDARNTTISTARLHALIEAVSRNDDRAVLPASRFDGATFIGGAVFGWVSFSGYAGFAGATFSGDADFSGATFSGSARFDGASLRAAPTTLQRRWQHHAVLPRLPTDQHAGNVRTRFRPAGAGGPRRRPRTPRR